MLQATTFYARNELIVSPLFEALFDCNIIWKSKYYDTFHLEHSLYADVAHEWLLQRKAQMNSYERILYWLFKKSKGVKLGSKYAGVPRTKERDLSSLYASKANLKWELASLYYTVPKPDDAAKQLIQ